MPPNTLARSAGSIAGLIVLLFAAFALSACQGQAVGAVPNPASASTPTPPRVDLGVAQQTAADFLNAWRTDNYDAMYNLLAAHSRDAFPRADFEKRYRDTDLKLTLLPDGKAYALTNAIQRGSDAQVAYEIMLQTRLFGPVGDTERMLTLLNTGEGWRVAWTPGDIFREFDEGATLEIVQERPMRGNIYDRDGEVIADQNGVSIVVTLRTQEYPGNNPDACFAELTRVFPMRSAEQMKRLFGPNTGRDFAYEIGQIRPERFAEERAALERYCTLDYENRPTRRYIAGGMAPHVVGYVGRIPAEQLDQWTARGYPQDALIGVDGIERYLEETLAGQARATLLLRLNGRDMRTLAERGAVASQSVYLSLDRPLQEGVQTMLRENYASAAWAPQSPGAAAVVMEVKTGRLLAIASYPDFDVEAFNPDSALPNAQALIAAWTNDPRKPTFNRAVLGQFPPGSVFKIFSMAAAYDSGVFNLNTRWTCTGTWNGTSIGDRTRKDWIAAQGGQHGNITLRQALIGSCNIYFWHIGWTLNNKDPLILPDYWQRFGFGASTGITDLADALGQLPDPTNYEKLTGRKWRGSDALNAVIGQGDVVTTPLQVVRAVAAVANGGTLYKPLLVEKIGIIGVPSYVAQPVAQGQINIKPEVLAGVRSAMCGVTSDPTIGTATFVFRDLKGAVVCGKTGTAETLPGAPTHAWFAAFAGKTADEPEIAVVVVVERGGEGSYVAAPLVRRIVEIYYKLVPTPDAQASG